MDTQDTDVDRGAEPSGALIQPPATLLEQTLRSLTRRELCTEDLYVSCFEGTLNHDVTFPAEGPAAFSITLVIEGSGRTLIDGVEPLDVAGGTAVVFWSEGPVSGVDHVDGGQRIQAVEIRLHPDYLRQSVGSIVDTLKSALLIDRSKPRAGAFLVSLPLSAELIEVARAILDCGIAHPGLRQVFMRGKALAAFALTINSLSKTSLNAMRLSPRERTKIDEARRLIESSFGEAWTIATLASAVGLSESKLKIGFREIVGTSVRSYLRDTRIENAAVLIRSGASVTEAALASGFGNLSHFSKAFNDVKGVGPRQYAKACGVDKGK